MVNDSAVVVFDDERAVANAEGLGSRRSSTSTWSWASVWVRRTRGARSCRWSRRWLGADCIENCNILRSGQTAAVLGHRVAKRAVAQSPLSSVSAEALAACVCIPSSR